MKQIKIFLVGLMVATFSMGALSYDTIYRDLAANRPTNGYFPGQVFVSYNQSSAPSIAIWDQTTSAWLTVPVSGGTIPTLTATTLTSTTFTTATITASGLATFNAGVVVDDGVAANGIDTQAVGASNTVAALLTVNGGRIASAGEVVLQSRSGNNILTVVDTDGNQQLKFTNAGAGALLGMDEGTAITITGAGQTITTATISRFVHIAASGAADVTIIQDPPGPFSTLITFSCNDANVTFTDNGSPTANTLAMAGNFVCSTNDTITLLYDQTNDYWKEVARSVN